MNNHMGEGGVASSHCNVLFRGIPRMTRGSLPWLCFYVAPLSTIARAPSTTRPWNSCSILPETEPPSFTEFDENDRVISPSLSFSCLWWSRGDPGPKTVMIILFN